MTKHPVDELAAVRLRLRGYRGREAQLRTMILNSECSWEGATHTADVLESTQVYANGAKLLEAFGNAEWLRPFLMFREVQTVTIKKR